MNSPGASIRIAHKHSPGVTSGFASDARARKYAATSKLCEVKRRGDSGPMPGAAKCELFLPIKPIRLRDESVLTLRKKWLRELLGKVGGFWWDWKLPIGFCSRLLSISISSRMNKRFLFWVINAVKNENNLWWLTPAGKIIKKACEHDAAKNLGIPPTEKN